MTKTILMALIAGSILSGVLIFALTRAARAATLLVEAAHRSKGRLPMRQRLHKIGLVLLISMLSLLPGEPQAFQWTVNGHRVASVSSSGADKFLKTSAAVAGVGLVASVAGPGALLVGGGLFFGAQRITSGINDAIGQAYADTKDLEDHAAVLAANLEQNAAYIIQEEILQANDIVTERTADLSELSSARIFDAQVAALNAAAAVERGFERLLILFLGCLVAAIVAAAALLRARGTVSLWRSGFEAVLVGTVVVVFAFPLLPRALALTGLKDPEQQFDTDLANHEESFEKAMMALKFNDAVTEALALQAYDPQNHNYVADYKKAKLLRTLFVSPLRLPDAAEAADALRQVTDIADSQDEPNSIQASVNATPVHDSERAKKTTAAQPWTVTEEGPDPDLLTVIAYVTAATAKDRATDAFAGIMASTALNSEETRPGVLTSLAGLILQNFCTIPAPSPTTIAATSKLQQSLSPDFVPPQTPEHVEPNLCVNLTSLKNPENGKNDIFTSLRTSSTSNDVLFQQTSVAFTTFLHRWFECMLPAANSNSCLPNPALNRDSYKSAQMVSALLTNLQEKVIKPWKEGFNTSVVNNGNATLATHFSDIDDTVYVRAQQYAILLSSVQQKLSKNETLSNPPIAIAPLLNEQTTKQYVIYIPTIDPKAQPGAMQLKFDFANIEYPNADKSTPADKSTRYARCTFDQPAMGDNSNSPVSIHSRWYACYVPGIGRDPLNLRAVQLENAILLRLHQHLTAISVMETNYQNIVRIEDGVALAQPQTWSSLWENFVSNAVELNLFANIDKSQASSESKCGTTIGSFACVERAWAYEHNLEYEPPASKDEESRLPQETTVDKLIAQSPSALIL